MHLPVPLEEAEAKWLMEWAHLTVWNKIRLSDILIHIPNGAYHGTDRKASAVTARKLREKGLKVGVYDYFLTVPCFERRVAGMWIELKRNDRTAPVSKAQKEFGVAMVNLGYHTAVAYGWADAAQAINVYLAQVGSSCAPIGNLKPEKDYGFIAKPLPTQS